MKRRSRPTLTLELPQQTIWPVPQLGEEAHAANEMCKERQAAGCLRVLTWNVWFDTLCDSKRQAALLAEVSRLAPDVCCFQEVVPPFLTALKQSALASVYEIESGKEIEIYGCAILVCKSLKPCFRYRDLPSTMMRYLLWATCEGAGGFTVMTSHFESLNNRATRRKQLELAATILQDVPHAVLCGDFNFDSTVNYGDWTIEGEPPCVYELGELENEVLAEVLPDFCDVWFALKPDDPGYTFDGATNGVCVQNSRERARIDRVLVQRGAASLVPKSVALTGTEDINDWGIKPSDHYGLYVDFGPDDGA